MTEITISRGVSEENKAKAGTLFLDAFGKKLSRFLGEDDRIHGFIVDAINPKFAISATDRDGTLLGIAGFKTAKGAFVEGSIKDLAKHYGWLTAIPRGLVAELIERKTEADCLLMDGICVDKTARGQGIGSLLLDAITDEARSQGLRFVRLDVIDANPRAKALYERKGFISGETQQLGLLRFMFGFRSSTTMRLAID